MLNINSINLELNETITDISFDWMGKRVALVTNKRKIIIYNHLADKWIKSIEFTAHFGPILKIKWAHPDFGSIIVTSSFDRSILVFEEKCQNNVYEFIEKIKITQGNYDILDIKFTPKFKGLILSAVYSSGYVKLYDINSQSPHEEIHSIKTFDDDVSPNCISWNKNEFDLNMFAIGSEVGKGIKIFGYFENVWEKLISFGEDDHVSGVNDISWGLLNGRQYHYIFTCGKEGSFVWRLNIVNTNITIIQKFKFINKEVISEPLRITCNFMATVICISYKNNIILFWNKTNNNEWELSEKINNNVLK